MKSSNTLSVKFSGWLCPTGDSQKGPYCMARCGNKYVPPSFSRNVLVQPCDIPLLKICLRVFKDYQNSVKSFFYQKIKAKIRKRVWQTHFWQHLICKVRPRFQLQRKNNLYRIDSFFSPNSYSGSFLKKRFEKKNVFLQIFVVSGPGINCIKIFTLITVLVNFTNNLACMD